MKFLILTLLMTMSVLPAAAQDWALGGYDAVGYSRSGQALPGRPDISTMWKGKVWHFATEDNRARFEADPRSYAPEFDGLCPVALARGLREPGDPQHFAIIGNHLYLLRSTENERVLMKAPREILTKAKQVWAGLR